MLNDFIIFYERCVNGTIFFFDKNTTMYRIVSLYYSQYGIRDIQKILKKTKNI
jgi:hypothetical protein